MSCWVLACIDNPDMLALPQAYRRGELGVEVVLDGEPASLPAPAPKAERAPKSNKGPSKKQAAGAAAAADGEAPAGPTRHSQVGIHCWVSGTVRSLPRCMAPE